MVKKIVSEIHDLDSKPDWEPVKTETNLYIKKRLGSNFSNEFLVSKLYFLFDRMISLKMLLDELNTDMKRKKWDKNLSIVENVENEAPSRYLLYSIFSVLMFKTEYLERKIVFEKAGSVYIVVYSVEDERKPIGNITRAFTFFGAIILSEKNMCTEVQVYNQTDPNSGLAKLGTGLGISKLSDWAKVFKTHIKKLLETSEKPNLV